MVSFLQGFPSKHFMHFFLPSPSVPHTAPFSVSFSWSPNNIWRRVPIVKLHGMSYNKQTICVREMFEIKSLFTFLYSILWPTNALNKIYEQTNKCTFCMYLFYNFCTTLHVPNGHFFQHQEFMIYCILQLCTNHANVSLHFSIFFDRFFW